MKSHLLLIPLFATSALVLAGCITNSRISEKSTTNANVTVVSENVNTVVNTNTVANENVNTDVSTNTNTVQMNVDISTNDNFLTFTTSDGSLRFAYNPDWKCIEAVTNEVIFCYPRTRISEEYDYGLGQPSVRMPDIEIHNENNCRFIESESTLIDASPIKKVGEDSPTFYYFYKQFNGCQVVIPTNDKIDTNEKLDKILHQ